MGATSVLDPPPSTRLPHSRIPLLRESVSHLKTSPNESGTDVRWDGRGMGLVDRSCIDPSYNAERTDPKNMIRSL
jgi:hypothetical protein